MEQIKQQITTTYSQTNPNVRLVFVFTLIYRVFVSLSLRTVLTVYMFQLAHCSNSTLGLVALGNGITEIALAFPGGMAADRFSRTPVLLAASLLGLVAIAVTAIGLASQSLPWLTIAFALWGGFEGLSNSPLNSLFADSVPTGGRSGIYGAKYALHEVSTCVGPALAIALFAFVGNSWDSFQMRLVIGSGLFFGAGACAVLFGFTDAASLGQESEAVNIDILAAKTAPAKDDDDDATIQLVENVGDVSDVRNSMVDPTSTSTPITTKMWTPYKHHWVPYIVAGVGVFLALGAGISVKYWPIFYQSEIGLTPIELSALYVASPIATGFSTYSARRISLWAGRLQTAIAFKLMGITCLYLMAVATSPTLSCFLFVARTAFQRAPVALERSILMDFAHKGARGKWNAIESISSVTFQGSAAVGGFLIDATSYRTTFAITASIYLFGTLFLIPALPLVPKNEASLRHQQSYAPLDHTNPDTDDDHDDHDDDPSHSRSSLSASSSSC